MVVSFVRSFQLWVFINGRIAEITSVAGLIEHRDLRSEISKITKPRESVSIARSSSPQLYEAFKSGRVNNGSDDYSDKKKTLHGQLLKKKITAATLTNSEL